MFPRVALLLLMASLAPAVARAAEGKWNVLFIAVDDLRPELGAYGKQYMKTPAIDALAGRGLLFNRAYCQQAVCCPSRSSLLTGARPDTTRVFDNQTHFRKTMPDVVTLPRFFKDNGYFTQGMGKLFHGDLDDPTAWSAPWSKLKVGHGAYATAANKERVAKYQAEFKAAKKAGKKQKEAERGPAFESGEADDNYFHDGMVADNAIAALRERAKSDQPFWLGVGFIRPHLPFVAPKKYWDLYDPAKIELAKNPFRPQGAPDYSIVDGGELRSYADIPTGHVPDDLQRTLRHGYYASISYMDAQVGRVLAELDRLGLRDRTIVILWGDHGWKLGEHDAWCKHSSVELDVNVPLILSVPEMKSAGKQSDALVELVDMYPSLAELCGLSLPKHLEGTSFATLVENPLRSWKTAAFSQYPRNSAGNKLMGYSMRTERYRFTRWVRQDDQSKVDAIELYDHQNDPDENVNIANEPKNADLVAQLTAQWHKGWRGAVPKVN